MNGFLRWAAVFLIAAVISFLAKANIAETVIIYFLLDAVADRNLP